MVLSCATPSRNMARKVATGAIVKPKCLWHSFQVTIPPASTYICCCHSCTTRIIRPVPLTDVMAQPPRISQPMPVPMIKEGMCPHQHHNQQWAVCPHSTSRLSTCAYGLCIVGLMATLLSRDPIRFLPMYYLTCRYAHCISVHHRPCVGVDPSPPPTIARHWRHTPRGRPWWEGACNTFSPPTMLTYLSSVDKDNSCHSNPRLHYLSC